jgi:glycosyltransferase involved in cell wall biosynthesis
VLHEVAIYSASSGGSPGAYDRGAVHEGGAERQMALLARGLTEQGRRVAHIIFTPEEPVELDYPLTLVFRPPRAKGQTRGVRAVHEVAAVVRALRAADAGVTVVRSASPAVALIGLYCKLRRRAFVFSCSNVSDLTLEQMETRWKTLISRLGIQLADTVVVQSEDQRALARRHFPRLRRVVRIPSFAVVDDAVTAGSNPSPDAFLWFGRCVPQKRPLQYVELARTLPEARFLMIPAPIKAAGPLFDRLQREAADVPNLELLELRPHAELQELVARCVAVVNTSTLEGMPNAFLEAWARGVPVLTLEFDPDRIVECARLGSAARGSWERFVRGARELWEGRSERAELATRVRAHVAEEHSTAAVAARWSALVDELLGR